MRQNDEENEVTEGGSKEIVCFVDRQVTLRRTARSSEMANNEREVAITTAREETGKAKEDDKEGG